MAPILSRVWLRKYLVVLWLLLAAAQQSQAEMPPHLVLHRPGATAWSTPHSQPVVVPAQSYPYGYFGARGRPQWQRQFGIHRTYTQWGQK